MVDSNELLENLRVGQSDAARAIFDRYVARMISLAGSKIGPKLKRRFDADDVLQSAFRSFFVHAKDGEYQLQESGNLWRLLASITLHKLHHQIERQTADKRSVHREVTAEELNAHSKRHEPSVVEAVALIDELQFVIDRLTPDERIVLTHTLQGESIEEISDAIGKSERTSRRLLAEIKQKLEQRLLADEQSEQEPTTCYPSPHAPLRYSDYLLEQLIGSGGMGKVYRAKEKTSGKTVAIKALHKSRQSDPRAVAQIVQEAEVLARLRHPNIVGVKGLGKFPNGGLFIVMEFVDGVNLQTRLGQGPLPLNEVIAIMTVVAHAIQYGHDRGVVHCDLKPANILLDKSGQVHVTDFGFAFLISGPSKVSQQHIGGTAGYIAPEILVRREKPTPAADIYGLGMLLWTLATGKSPDVFEHKANTLPEGVRQICGRCVANDPAERYKSPSEFASDLHERVALSARFHGD